MKKKTKRKREKKFEVMDYFAWEAVLATFVGAIIAPFFYGLVCYTFEEIRWFITWNHVLIALGGILVCGEIISSFVMKKARGKGYTKIGMSSAIGLKLVTGIWGTLSIILLIGILHELLKVWENVLITIGIGLFLWLFFKSNHYWFNKILKNGGK